jgi:hypothetical protein
MSDGHTLNVFQSQIVYDFHRLFIGVFTFFFYLISCPLVDMHGPGASLYYEIVLCLS